MRLTTLSRFFVNTQSNQEYSFTRDTRYIFFLFFLPPSWHEGGIIVNPRCCFGDRDRYV